MCMVAKSLDAGIDFSMSLCMCACVCAHTHTHIHTLTLSHSVVTHLRACLPVSDHWAKGTPDAKGELGNQSSSFTTHFNHRISLYS